jgi:type IV pilus assembly protein PilO
MARSFNLPGNVKLKDPRVAVRLVLGTLLVANVVAALIVFRPWGGSADDLARQQQQLRQQLAAVENRLKQTQVVVTKVEQARKEGDEFQARYITDRRTTMSTIGEELNLIAQQAGVTPKGSVTNMEPVEGSDTLWQMTISEIYEGQYAQLAKLINLLDRSDRFLIISNMVATPKSSGNVLTVTLRLDTFVRAEPGSES